MSLSALFVKTGSPVVFTILTYRKHNRPNSNCVSDHDLTTKGLERGLLTEDTLVTVFLHYTFRILSGTFYTHTSSKYCHIFVVSWDDIGLGISMGINRWGDGSIGISDHRGNPFLAAAYHSDKIPESNSLHQGAWDKSQHHVKIGHARARIAYREACRSLVEIRSRGHRERGNLPLTYRAGVEKQMYV